MGRSAREFGGEFALDDHVVGVAERCDDRFEQDLVLLERGWRGNFVDLVGFVELSSISFQNRRKKV